MKILSVVLATAALLVFSVSCDKHSWDSTKELHEGTHKAHGEAHGDAHGKADAHAAEKPAHGEEKKPEAKH